MTVRALTKRLKETLGELRAKAILSEVLGLRGAALILCDTETVSKKDEKKIEEILSRLEAGEPIQYLLGSWTFMDRTYQVGEGVLIPRDDTEVAVNAALELLENNRRAKVLDLCSGSGIIAISLKSAYPDAEITAVEKSEKAFSYLEKNAELHHALIKLINADLSDCVGEFEDDTFDLIISNPPYIKSAELPTLMKEVSFEPKMALDGGVSGLDFFERIIGSYTKKIKKGGYFIFELAEDQSQFLETRLKDAGFDEIRFFPDIQNTLRAVRAKRA